MTFEGENKSFLSNEMLIFKRGEIDHFQMQGAIFMFCTLLQKTDDTELIYSMYLKIMDEHYDLEVFDGKGFLIRYIKEYSDCNYVDFAKLCDKLIWIIKEENDDDNELKNLGLV